MSFDLGPTLSFGAQGIFYILLFLFTVHAIFLAYHWFSYGTRKEVSLIALAAYLSGGAILLLTLSVLLGKM